MKDPVKAITVRQPWAWAIIMGYKDVENRSRRTDRRGPLLIHAGLKWDPQGFLFLWEMGLHRKLPRKLHRGALVGEVQLSDSQYGFDSDWAAAGHWQWIFSGPKEFKSPLWCPGAQGFFVPDVSSHALGQVRRNAIGHRRR